MSWQAGAGGGANTQLSNLIADTAVNQHLLPSADNLRDLGRNADRRWRDLWLSRNASVLGTMIVGGATTLVGNVFMLNDVSVSGVASFDNDVTLGNSGTDEISAPGDWITDIDFRTGFNC